MRKGYSILELITVLATAGILTTAVIPAYHAVTNHAQELKNRSDKKVVSVVKERFNTRHGRYPISVEEAAKDGGILEEDSNP